jgi:hypothetical protein
VKRNTKPIVQLAAEKSRRARFRVMAAITMMQADRVPINFNTVCHAARVSKTFLYDSKHADLAEQIRSLRQLGPAPTARETTGASKSDSAKDAQMVRFKERIKTLEERVRVLQEENEVLYGKLSQSSLAHTLPPQSQAKLPAVAPGAYGKGMTR